VTFDIPMDDLICMQIQETLYGILRDLIMSGSKEGVGVNYVNNFMQNVGELLLSQMTTLGLQ